MIIQTPYQLLSEDYCPIYIVALRNIFCFLIDFYFVK